VERIKYFLDLVSYILGYAKEAFSVVVDVFDRFPSWDPPIEKKAEVPTISKDNK
jgi:hypothetical protein